MRSTRAMGVAIAALLVAAPLAAQGGMGQGRQGRSGMGGMGGDADRMLRNPVEQVLESRAELGLTEAQIAGISAIRDRLAERTKAQREQLAAARGDVEPREMTPEQRREMRVKMQELAPVLQSFREANRAAMAEVHEILDDAQDATLRQIMSRRTDRPGRGGGLRPARAPGGTATSSATHPARSRLRPTPPSARRSAEPASGRPTPGMAGRGCRS